jgi:hypothetical protein
MKKIIVLCVLFIVGCTPQTETNTIHLLPEGYEGTLIVVYNVEGQPPLKKEGEYNVIPYNENGIYLTSTPDMQYGTVNDKYYYRGNGIRKKISEECVYSNPNGSYQFEEGGKEFPHYSLVVTANKCSNTFKLEGPQNERELKDSDRYELILQELVKVKAIEENGFY